MHTRKIYLPFKIWREDLSANYQGYNYTSILMIT